MNAAFFNSGSNAKQGVLPTRSLDARLKRAERPLVGPFELDELTVDLLLHGRAEGREDFEAAANKQTCPGQMQN